MKKESTVNENWVKEENLTQWKRKAEQNLADCKRHEKSLIKSGKKQVLVDHPTAPRCKIVKFV